MLTKYATKKRITFDVILNTVCHVILQYFTVTCWVSKVCPFRIDLECQTTLACQFWNLKTNYFENYAQYCKSWYFAAFLRNRIFFKRKLFLYGFTVHKCPRVPFLNGKSQLVSELYQFLPKLQYILCILQHPVDFSKARPFWIDLEYETTHVYKFSCLGPHLTLKVLNSLD